MDESLADLRKQIDALDSQLSEMLAARLEVSRKVSAAKKDNSQVFRPAREAQLLGKLLAAAPASLQQLIPVVWRAIISSSIAEQRPDFTILASPQMGVQATAFAAGQLGVKNGENLDTALAELIDKQADILLVSPEELCRIAGDLGPDKPAMVIACLPLVCQNRIAHCLASCSMRGLPAGLSGGRLQNRQISIGGFFTCPMEIKLRLPNFPVMRICPEQNCWVFVLSSMLNHQ